MAIKTTYHCDNCDAQVMMKGSILSPFKSNGYVQGDLEKCGAYINIMKTASQQDRLNEEIAAELCNDCKVVILKDAIAKIIESIDSMG